MNNGLGAVCDEFYVSGRLFLRLELSPERETILHFFDRLCREYPGLRKMRRRDGGSLILEEDVDERGSRRWVRLDRNSLRFGQFAPPQCEDVRRFGELILSQAPFHLTFSPLDYDHLEVVYGFDLEYRGNHDQLVAEALMVDYAATNFLFGDHAARVIDAQPYFGIALTPECDLQAYVEIKSRTSTYEVRNDAYEGAPISVFLTLRQYFGGSNAGENIAETMNSLFETADRLASERVVPHFVNPLAAAIASRS